MQLDFLFSPRPPAEECLQLSAETVPLRFVRNDAARRYILRIAEDGSARVTVPRRGSIKAAREFVQRQIAWIEKQLHKRATRADQSTGWVHGTEILFRGERSPLLVDFDRRKSVHASFGSGPHICPGAGLARREILVFLQEWLRRIPEFRIKEGTHPVLATGMVNGVTKLELAWA